MTWGQNTPSRGVQWKAHASLQGPPSRCPRTEQFHRTTREEGPLFSNVINGYCAPSTSRRCLGWWGGGTTGGWGVTKTQSAC